MQLAVKGIYFGWEQDLQISVLKSTGRDNELDGRLAACVRCHLAHAAWFAHVPYLRQSHDGSILREPA